MEEFLPRHSTFKTLLMKNRKPILITILVENENINKNLLFKVGKRDKNFIIQITIPKIKETIPIFESHP